MKKELYRIVRIGTDAKELLSMAFQAKIAQNTFSFADPREGGTRDVRPLLGPISFLSMQFLAKLLPNNGFLPQTQRLTPSSGKLHYCKAYVLNSQCTHHGGRDAGRNP